LTASSWAGGIGAGGGRALSDRISSYLGFTSEGAGRELQRERFALTDVEKESSANQRSWPFHEEVLVPATTHGILLGTSPIPARRWRLTRLSWRTGRRLGPPAAATKAMADIPPTGHFQDRSDFTPSEIGRDSAALFEADGGLQVKTDASRAGGAAIASWGATPSRRRVVTRDPGWRPTRVVSRFFLPSGGQPLAGPSQGAFIGRGVGLFGPFGAL